MERELNLKRMKSDFDDVFSLALMRRGYKLAIMQGFTCIIYTVHGRNRQNLIEII